MIIWGKILKTKIKIYYFHLAQINNSLFLMNLTAL